MWHRDAEDRKKQTRTEVRSLKEMLQEVGIRAGRGGQEDKVMDGKSDRAGVAKEMCISVVISERNTSWMSFVMSPAGK